MRNLFLSIMLAITIVAFGQDFSSWGKYSCDIYRVNDNQNPSICVASVLKEIKGIYYTKAEIDVGKYQVELTKIAKNFFRIKGTCIYLELLGYIPYSDDYRGILEVEAMIVQSPFDNSYSCVGTTEYLYLEP